MIFVTKPDIGRMVLKELRSAVDVRLAVAYFRPNDEVLSALCSTPRLTLIISEEFTINDPYKLETLPSNVILRSVPPDSENGKLHAKVLIVKRSDDSLWLLVGSANLTWQGLFANQEACIVLESRNTADRESVGKITEWFDTLLASARFPDIDVAKKLYDARSLYRLEHRPPPTQANEKPIRYWALKTKSGSDGEEHWENFKTDSVIAIGWEGIKVDPSKVSKSQLRAAIAEAHGGDEPNRAAMKIQKFIELNDGDIVLICKGYTSNQQKPVHIYGFARVTGPFFDDRFSGWKWRFKHKAVIQYVEKELPRDVVAKSLKKDSLRETIHEIDQSGLESLAEQLGILIKV